MKKIIIALSIGFLTLHCEPPPEKPEEDQNLRLENLIYTVAFSSLKVAAKMDIKRRDNVLKQMRKQLETEREKFSVELNALEERIKDLIKKDSLLTDGIPGSKESATVKIQKSDAKQETPLSLKEQLVQLETVVFGEEDSKGFLLFRIKFLSEKWDLLNPSSSGEVPEDPVEVKPFQLESPDKEMDNEMRLKNLAGFIYGEGDSPGVLSQLEELEKALPDDGLTADQMETLEKKTEDFVQEQKARIFENASVEDQIAQLENLIYGTEEKRGIIAQIRQLQSALAPN